MKDGWEIEGQKCPRKTDRIWSPQSVHNVVVVVVVVVVIIIIIIIIIIIM